MLHERFRIFSPEAYGVHVVRIQTETGDLVAVKGVHTVEEAFANAVHKPIAVEGGNVGASTC